MRSTNETQTPPNVEKKLKEFQYQTFEPQFIRPAPPLFDPQPGEVRPMRFQLVPAFA